jgi:cytochrome c55X
MHTLAFFFMVFCLITVVGATEHSTTQTPAIDSLEQVQLVRLVRQDCGSCHGMSLQGGLGTPLTRAALNGKPAEYLAATILYGRPGTAMPPWKTLLTEGQAQWIADRLLEGFPEERH